MFLFGPVKHNHMPQRWWKSTHSCQRKALHCTGSLAHPPLLRHWYSRPDLELVQTDASVLLQPCLQASVTLMWLTAVIEPRHFWSNAYLLLRKHQLKAAWKKQKPFSNQVNSARADWKYEVRIEDTLINVQNEGDAFNLCPVFFLRLRQKGKLRSLSDKFGMTWQMVHSDLIALAGVVVSLTLIVNSEL